MTAPFIHPKPSRRGLAAAAELPDLPVEFEKLLAQRESQPPSTSDAAKSAHKPKVKKKHLKR